MRLNYILGSFFLITTFIACNKNEDEEYNPIDENPLAELNLPSSPFDYTDINLPDYYLNNYFQEEFTFQHAAIAADNTPSNNPITNEGATLGRVLFYDTKLSANGTISCASCHQAEHGFSDSKPLSDGFNGGKTRRHSTSIVNARFNVRGKFFWDERASTLEEQVLMPFLDPVEMGLSLTQLEEIVAAQKYYPILFQEAFGDTEINNERISKALAQFIRSMVSTTSKYDKARAQVSTPIENFPTFTEQENRGKTLFYRRIESSNGSHFYCASCHISEAFVGPIPNQNETFTSLSTNNGLDSHSVDDLGIYETTNNPNDIGKFKAPSLKNIAVSSPYMHDGRFETLEEVIEHYNSGIQNHPNLSSPLKDDNGNPIRLGLTEEDKQALIAFLHTLTDNEMLEDEKFSNPFK